VKIIKLFIIFGLTFIVILLISSVAALLTHLKFTYLYPDLTNESYWILELVLTYGGLSVLGGIIFGWRAFPILLKMKINRRKENSYPHFLEKKDVNQRRKN